MIELILFIIAILYLFLIGSFVYGFEKIKPIVLNKKPNTTRFSIIIPFRNEGNNLTNLLKSLHHLNYDNSLFEVLFVNDESNDDSVEIIETFKLKNPNLNISIIESVRITKSPKKDAITLAIGITKNDWIVTTDADCIVPPFWLDSFDEFIQKNITQFISAPVTYANNHSLLNRFQLLDILSLQGATIGGFGIQKPFLCNAANLAYKKSFFNALDGFEGNTNIASGDDVFLLQKAIKKEPNSVHYLKSKHAIVLTDSEPNINRLIEQRKRWAAKTSSYNNFGKLSGLLVLLMNAVIICSFVLLLIGLLKFRLFLYLFIIKASIDFLLIYKTARFFEQERYLASYLFSSIIYPFFNVYIAFTSLFNGYKWKNRHFSK